MVISSDEQSAEAQAKATVKRAHTSFYWAMRLLRREKRNAMYAIYAFCRVVDDIADDPVETGDKFKRLEFWRTEVIRIFRGAPSGPIGEALSSAIKRYQLPQEDFLAIIDGMEMDAGGQQYPVRIASMDELNLYCDRVASAVGRLSNRVFGLEGEKSDRLARSLGRALQLTNILRDVSEDADRNRLYLPVDLLKRHGIEMRDLQQVLKSDQLNGVCNELAGMAQRDFQEAGEILAQLPRANIRPVLIMKNIYQPLLHRMVRRGWADLDKPVRLSRIRKFWIILRTGILGE